MDYIKEQKIKFNKKFNTNGYLCQYNSELDSFTSCPKDVEAFLEESIRGGMERVIGDIPNVCDEHPNCIEGTKNLLRTKHLGGQDEQSECKVCKTNGLHSAPKDTTQDLSDWEERFDKEFKTKEFWLSEPFMVKRFIKIELEKARKEGAKEIVEAWLKADQENIKDAIQAYKQSLVEKVKRLKQKALDIGAKTSSTYLITEMAGYRNAINEVISLIQEGEEK